MSIETRRELIQALGTDPRRMMHRELYRMRRRLWNGLQETLSRRSASLLAAMLLGLSGTVAPGVKRLFRNTGTAHLLAISGLHVGIVCAMLVFFLDKLGMEGRFRFWLLLGALFVFCLLSGGRTPVSRAYLVCAMHLYAIRARRPVDSFLPLFNACLVLLLMDPGALFELSFQLSFAGYGSILAFLKIRSLLSSGRANRRGTLKERPLSCGWFLYFMRKTGLLLGVSTASWLGTLPLTLHCFQYFNPWTPAVNLLVFPFFVGVLNIGAVHLAAAAIGLHRSLLTAWPAEACISLFFRWLETLETLPPGRIDIPPIPGTAVFLAYGMIILAFLGLVRIAAFQGNRMGLLERRSLGPE
jgi:competence protein ComEC